MVRRCGDAFGTLGGRCKGRLTATHSLWSVSVWSLITIVAAALLLGLFVMSVLEAPNRTL